MIYSNPGSDGAVVGKRGRQCLAAAGDAAVTPDGLNALDRRRLPD